jgi:translocation and assembly module TamB
VTGTRILADPEKLARLPYIPADVWQQIQPHGLLGVHVGIRVRQSPNASIDVRTEIDFLETSVRFPTLGLAVSRTVGSVEIEGGVVRLAGIHGRALGGTVSADGRLDLGLAPPRLEVDLGLDRVRVANTPREWRLSERGIAGSLSGIATLRIVLANGEVDLSASTGHGVIENASFLGMPIESVRLTMQAAESEQDRHGGEWRPRSLAHTAADSTQSVSTSGPAIQFPKDVRAEVTLHNVDVAELSTRMKAVGIQVPTRIAGRLSGQLDATLPFQRIGEIDAWKLRAEVGLKNAVVEGLAIESVDASLSLENGVLDVRDFRGTFSAPNAQQGPMVLQTVPAGGGSSPPPGRIQGRLRAAIQPPGRVVGEFFAHEVPIQRLTTPRLDAKSAVTGTLHAKAHVAADLKQLADPGSWEGSAEISSNRVSCGTAVLDGLSAAIELRDGRLEVRKFTAHQAGRPLSGELGIDLRSPHAFGARVEVTDWQLDDLLTVFPSVAHSVPITGRLSARANAVGTLAPWRIEESTGDGVLAAVRFRRTAFGDLPFRWTTERAKGVIVADVEGRAFRGSVDVQARIPMSKGTIEGWAEFSHIDASQIGPLLPRDDLKLGGFANGKLSFQIRMDGSDDQPPFSGSLRLSAPELSIRNVAAEALIAELRLRGGVLAYDAHAESLGGKVQIKGEVALSPDTTGPQASGRAQAVGFQLAELWRGFGVTGALARFQGIGAVDAAVRASAGLGDVQATGVFEFRELRWGSHLALGHLRGTVTRTSSGWRLDPLAGELLGGTAKGAAWAQSGANGGDRGGFDVDLDRVSLKRALAFLPWLARHADGTGVFHLAGRLADSLYVDGEATVEHARILGLPLTELKVPIEMRYSPQAGVGELQVRRLSGRFAGGVMRADGTFHFGSRRDFSVVMRVTELDLESFTRLSADTRRPASGRISGSLAFSGSDPADLRKLRGKIDLDLDDASLFELPVFRELGRFFGASRGGVFEDGSLSASIANRQILVDELTLAGRVAQIHASGTVGFDSQLNLEVLVNTSQIIPETGQSLVAIIPGLGEVLGRRDQAFSRVSNYLSNRLLKLRVTGTLRNPQVNVDPAIAVTEAAVGFFGGIMKLPLSLVR